MSILPRFLLLGLLIWGCNHSSPTQDTDKAEPWVIGQSAEGVLGRSAFTANGTDTVRQNTIAGPWGLAISATGTLFVVDQRGNRVLRFDHADAKSSGADADGVLGQSDFNKRDWNYNLGGSTPSANGLETPVSVALDPAGNLFVLDQGNSRVLRFDKAASKANGAAADGVLGQKDFTSKGFGSTASTFFSPQGVATDALGNLYVADGSNHRVLRFDHAASKANGADADAVLGQASLTATASGAGKNKMWNPTSVAVDKDGNLYVGERGNGRVLVFLNAKSKANGADADLVLGKPDFADITAPTLANRATVYLPYALAVDEKKNLYVADGGHNRVLVFYDAPSKKNGDSADVVIGKPNFTQISVTGASEANLGQPYGIAVQSATGKLFATCYSNSRVLRFQAKSSLMP